MDINDRDHNLEQHKYHFHRHSRIASLSEFSDSPSVYSHACFTPHQPDRRDIDQDSTSFVFDLPSNYSAPHTEPRSPMFHHEHLNNDRIANSLDLEDQCSRDSSYMSAEDHDDYQSPDSDADSDHRMSFLGPRMRIHSPAPWEAGTGVQEVGNGSIRSGIFGMKNRTKTPNPKGEVIVGAFSRTSTSKPSMESARSQAQSQGSETTSGNYSTSPRALYAMAHQTFSNSSLTPLSSAPGTSSLLQNIPPRIAASLPATNHNQSLQDSEDMAFSPYHDTPRQHERTRTSSSPRELSPDLVSFLPEVRSPSRSVFGLIPRSESNAIANGTLNSESAMSSNITAGTSTASLVAKSREQTAPSNIRLQGREISAPRPVENIVLVHGPNSIGALSGGASMQRWIDHPPSPTVTLISLQEAQAMARERSRSAAIQDSASMHTTLSRIPNPSIYSQENESAYDCSSMDGRDSLSRASGVGVGWRARNALQSMVGAPQQQWESEYTTSGQTTPQRPLKHKKSAFMRIFNGRERDKHKAPSAPVPALMEVFSENHTLQHLPKTPKLPPTQVPVPLPSSPLQNAFFQPIPAIHSVSGPSDVKHGIKHEPSPPRKHAPRRLTLVSDSSSHASRPLTVISDSPIALSAASSQLHVPASVNTTSPQSAPPNSSDFQALKLRPVSTAFSAHFADITHPPTDLEAETASSFYTATSSALRSDGRPSPNAPGDQSMVIQALQDQIISAKKAWQRQIWELEGQVRDLQAEVEDLRADGKGYCEVCGSGSVRRDDDYRPRCELVQGSDAKSQKGGVVNRPRARTGDAARFGRGH